MGNIVTALIILVTMAIYSLTAFWIGINGITTIQSIERLPLLLAPASFVYLITFIIFAGLLYYVWLAFKNRQTAYSLTGLQIFIILLASFLQISFFYSWHYENFFVAVIILAIQLLSIFVLHTTYPLQKDATIKRAPIALWFGWNLFFLCIVTNYLIVYSGWTGFGLSNALWAVIILTVCTAIALHLRYHHYDRITPSVIIWGFLGVIIANGFDELFVSTATLFLIGVLIASILLLEKKQKKTA